MYQFCRYDVTKDKFIDFNELKLMMEKIGAPQTHLSLKAMIKEVDEDHDDKINFREVSYELFFGKSVTKEVWPTLGLLRLWATASLIKIRSF